MISGKEAYNLIGQGFLVLAHVQQSDNSMKWEDASQLPACDILNDGFDFKLQSKTITINGIEVPCCGENYQYGDAMYILNSLEPEEYSLVVLDKADEVPAFWWKTEDEIKQVVAALRSIFNESHSNSD